LNFSEKTVLEKDDHHELSPPAGEKSNITPTVPLHVIVKLLAFTFAMVVFPLASYFLTLNYVFNGNSTFAGATAAIIANVVLAGYVVVAFKEDQSDAIEAAEKEKKAR